MYCVWAAHINGGPLGKVIKFLSRSITLVCTLYDSDRTDSKPHELEWRVKPKRNVEMQTKYHQQMSYDMRRPWRWVLCYGAAIDCPWMLCHLPYALRAWLHYTLFSIVAVDRTHTHTHRP